MGIITDISRIRKNHGHISKYDDQIGKNQIDMSFEFELSMHLQWDGNFWKKIKILE